MNNKYLEKQSSLLAGAIGTHIAQNVFTRYLVRTPEAAQKLANSFASGYHGVVDNSWGHKALSIVAGAASPDLAIMHKQMHALGSALGPHLRMLTPRQQVGVRMIAEGKFQHLVAQGHHRDPAIQNIARMISLHTKMPIHNIGDLSQEGAKKLEEVWHSPEHPLLSNIARRIGRGKLPEVSKPAQAQSLLHAGIGAVSAGLVDPAAGLLNSAKTFASSHYAERNKYIAHASRLMREHLIEHPIMQGAKQHGEDFLRGIKNRAVEFGVNPMTASLKHTSSAITDAWKKALPGPDGE